MGLPGFISSQIIRTGVITLLALLFTQSVNAASTVFDNVRVVDVAAGKVIRDWAVVVSNDRIQAVGDPGAVEIPEGALRIDGGGRYLTPGLMDMHTHTETADQLIVNMAHGVTTIRVMWGNPKTLALRAAVNSGVIPGPRIVAAGMLLDGNPPYWPNSPAMTQPLLAHDIVAGQNAQGYDFVKVYSRLTSDVFHAIADAGRALDIEVSGHVPQAMDIREAVAAGMRTSEHFIGVFKAVMVDGVKTNPDVSPMFEDTRKFMEKIGRGEIDVEKLIDWNKVDELGEWLAQQPHWLVPTHDIMRNFTDDPLDPFTENFRFLTPEQMAIFGNLDPAAVFGLSADQVKGESLMYPLRTRVLRKLHQAGVKILVGTDQNTNVGLATVAEMQALHKAGVSREAVMRSATSETANYLGMRGELGEVKEGQIADLLLVDGNPLKNFDAFKNIHGVMTRGQWHDRATLDAMLEGVVQRAATAVD